MGLFFLSFLGLTHFAVDLFALFLSTFLVLNIGSVVITCYVDVFCVRRLLVRLVPWLDQVMCVLIFAALMCVLFFCCSHLCYLFGVRLLVRLVPWPCQAMRVLVFAALIYVICLVCACSSGLFLGPARRCVY